MDNASTKNGIPMSARELNLQAERELFEAAFPPPQYVFFTSAQTYCGHTSQDRSVAEDYQRNWTVWLAARRADLEIRRPDTGSHLDSEAGSVASDTDLIEWLDKLYSAEASGAVTNQKWPPAQYAIAAIKQYALPAEPKKAVSSMDRAELQVEVFELRAQLAALVSTGYTLSPIEPTEAMVHAAEDIPAPRPFGKVYRAMLDAAPKPEQLVSTMQNGGTE